MELFLRLEKEFSERSSKEKALFILRVIKGLLSLTLMQSEFIIYCLVRIVGRSHLPFRQLHGPSMFVVKAKIYGVLHNQSSSIAFDETSSYWSAPKSS